MSHFHVKVSFVPNVRQEELCFLSDTDAFDERSTALFNTVGAK